MQALVFNNGQTSGLVESMDWYLSTELEQPRECASNTATSPLCATQSWEAWRGESDASSRMDAGGVHHPQLPLGNSWETVVEEFHAAASLSIHQAVQPCDTTVARAAAAAAAVSTCSARGNVAASQYTERLYLFPALVPLSVHPLPGSPLATSLGGASFSGNVSHALLAAGRGLGFAQDHHTAAAVPQPGAGSSNEVAAATRARLSLGLPARPARLYTCAQTLFKFHPAFDAVLADILQRDPGGVLVLIHGVVAAWADLLRARLGAALPGLDVAQRVVFVRRLSHSEYLTLLALSDVVLDPWPFGGGLSNHEALLVGSPIVTLPSHVRSGRLTAGMLTRFGLPTRGMVVGTAAQYARAAVALATASSGGHGQGDDAAAAAAAVRAVRSLAEGIGRYDGGGGGGCDGNISCSNAWQRHEALSQAALRHWARFLRHVGSRQEHM